MDKFVYLVIGSIGEWNYENICLIYGYIFVYIFVFLICMIMIIMIYCKCKFFK